MVIGLTFLSFCFVLVSFFGYPPSLAPPPPLSVHPPVLRSLFFKLPRGFYRSGYFGWFVGRGGGWVCGLQWMAGIVYGLWWVAMMVCGSWWLLGSWVAVGGWRASYSLFLSNLWIWVVDGNGLVFADLVVVAWIWYVVRLRFFFFFFSFY